MSCDLNSIVSLGICPDESPSLSGLNLMQAAGITPRNLSNIASDFDTNGIAMAMNKKQLAITQVRNDFYGALNQNKVITTLTNTEYAVSYFKPEINKGTYSGYRGIVLNKNLKYKGSLRSTYIDAIELYPLASGSVTIQVKTGGVNYNYEVDVIANQINRFDKDNLEDFPFIIPPQFASVSVLVDSSTIPFASSYITCKEGCNNTKPNECGSAKGYNGKSIDKHEGYGVNVIFHCVCDYDKILCDMATSFTGELIWLKWQIAIFEEQVMSNRFNNWVVYNQDDISDKLLPQLRNAYAVTWNKMMDGLFAMLRNYNDDCLDCRGIRVVPNI